MSEASTDKKAVSAVFEVTSVQLLALQKFGVMESQTFKFVLQFLGIEE
jgi:hypothetical protein